MDEPRGFQAIEEFQNVLRHLDQFINELPKEEIDLEATLGKKFDVLEKTVKDLKERQEERLTREARTSPTASFANPINMGRFGKLGDDKEINMGRFGKLGDDLFADGILSVFNNIDESKSSLLKVENKFRNDTKRLQFISQVRNNLDEVVSRFNSVVDEHIEVNDKNCSSCACNKMDNSYYFIMALQESSNEFLIELRNKIKSDENGFWTAMEMDNINDEKKKQLTSLVNVLSEI
jgi:hypothetical protein